MFGDDGQDTSDDKGQGHGQGLEEMGLDPASVGRPMITAGRVPMMRLVTRRRDSGRVVGSDTMGISL